MIALKRAYDKPAPKDGARVLVERLWPRGVKKETARISVWLKDLAPSTGLRKWFHARPRMWLQFRERYLKELAAPEACAALEELYFLAHTRKNLTLVFGSRDTEHNSAVVLKELLEGMRKPPSSSGPEKAGAAPARMRAKK
jgi:uncharacterized protein YeaO (DUF488 family)